MADEVRVQEEGRTAKEDAPAEPSPAHHEHPAMNPFSPETVVELEREGLDDEEMPRVHLSGRSMLFGVLFLATFAAFLIFVLPQIDGLQDTWKRIEDGNVWWLIVCGVFTVLSFGGYVGQFHGIFTPGAPRKLTSSEAYQICMAALAASRLFSAAGAGGLALQAWAMRRSGMSRRMVADRTITFLVLQYWIYTAAIAVFGLGLYWGILSGKAPFAITVLPAILAIVAMAIAGLIALTPTDLQRRLEGWAQGHGRLARLAQRLATGPAAASAGVRAAIGHVVHPDRALFGAAAYWAFNIAVLWAAFHAFGEPPTLGVLVMIYFVGMLGNLLPDPGGVGGVDGGMIGSALAFGVSSDLAVVSVLTYRAFAFWLPTLPGIVAYLQLRRTVARWRAEGA
jgi:uncharacterized protein (TIRG00374 family)